MQIEQQTWCLFGDSCSGVMHMWNSRPLGDRVICAPGPARTGHGCRLACREQDHASGFKHGRFQGHVPAV